jgi:hypothetical protein
VRLDAALAQSRVESNKGEINMTNLKGVFRVVSAFVLLLTGCGLVPAPARTADQDDRLSPEVRRELAEARRATAKYHDITVAIADGYVDINVFVSGQGFHFLRPEPTTSTLASVDGVFHADRPELLIYTVDPTLNHLRLVAVEYAVAVDLSPTAPEGFPGDADVWDKNETFHLWTLHAWIWRENPNGVFADINPLVP